MPDLNFQIESAAALPHAAAPTLALKLRIDNARPEEPVHAAMLRCQVQIEATRRPYASGGDVFDRLNQYNSRGALLTWKQALERLLDQSETADSLKRE